MPRPDEGPGALAWLLAFIGFLLPWVAALVALTGIWRIGKGESAGYWHLAAASAILIADTLIDRVWADPSVLQTDQPDLNRRPEQLVGRVAVVEEAITRGRGKVRVDDTLWPAEGPDTPAGTLVRVTDARGAVLVVVPA